MTLGAHWPADPWLKLDVLTILRRARLMRAQTIVFPLYHDLWTFPENLHARHMGILRQLLEEFEVIGRLMWSGRPPIPEYYADDWAYTLNEAHAIGLASVVIHNEPNLTGGGEGWGTSDHQAVDFCLWLVEVCKLMDQRWPRLQRIFPGLAVMQNDLTWLHCALGSIQHNDLRRFVDAFACHVYWERDHWRTPEWGQRHHLYRAALGDHTPLLCLELGNSSPEIPIIDKARQYCEWDKIAPEWLQKRIVFTLGGDGWDDFTLTDEACAIIGRHNDDCAQIAPPAPSPQPTPALPPTDLQLVDAIWGFLGDTSAPDVAQDHREAARDAGRAHLLLLKQRFGL